MRGRLFRGAAGVCTALGALGALGHCQPALGVGPPSGRAGGALPSGEQTQAPGGAARGPAEAAESAELLFARCRQLYMSLGGLSFRSRAELPVTAAPRRLTWPSQWRDDRVSGTMPLGSTRAAECEFCLSRGGPARYRSAEPGCSGDCWAGVPQNAMLMLYW